MIVEPLHAAVIDTPVFQRLRYIRQTGLLHFVFPGAVHTRFAHSIGTMHLARRVFAVLFPDYQPHRRDPHSPLNYVGHVFELAALLHDVGHCAFSHAMEGIKVDGKPIFSPMAELVKAWRNPALSAWWTHATTSGQYTPPAATEHEQIGLLLIGMIFSGAYERVAEACGTELAETAENVAADVRALVIKERLEPSPRFLAAAAEIVKGVPHVADVHDPASDLLNVLHTLISGTLDVDRLDYLRRDSVFTGTTYGICDTQILVGSLLLAVDRSDGRLELALRSRAVQALDDFMWSRFQLFLQVLNHKTNVILNAMLAEAIPEVFRSPNIAIGRPRELVDFLELTDDQVMSSVTRACLREQKEGTAYDRALFRRQFPLYLGAVDLTGDAGPDAVSIERKQATFAREVLGSEDKKEEIGRWTAKSDLVKGGGLPFVLQRDKVSQVDLLLEPGAPGTYKIHEWTTSGKLPARIEQVHFFVDRDKLPGG